MERKRDVPERSTKASNRVAPPEPEGVERQKPERGLTLELSGHINREAIDWSA